MRFAFIKASTFDHLNTWLTKKKKCHWYFSNSESLAELQHDQRGYDRPIRASGIQINVYDTINNENNVSDNTQFIADSMNTGEHANILCNANNIETSAHANSPCNAENIETGAHAKIPCNADNVDHVYENLKIF